MFKVINIIDANTIQVEPNWNWRTSTGRLVQIVGYKVSDAQYSSFVISRLNTLIKGKQIALKNPINVIERPGENILFCSVYLNDVDITQYFPEFKQQA